MTLTHYVSTRDIWDKKKKKFVVNNVFSFKVVIDITRSNNDHEMEPQYVEECQCINDWPMWLGAI